MHEPSYIDTTSAADRFLGAVEQSSTVAVDTEGASFHRFVDRIYLLQMSTRELTAVLDPLPIGKPAALGRILESDTIEEVCSTTPTTICGCCIRTTAGTSRNSSTRA